MKNDQSRLIHWIVTFFLSSCIAIEKRLQRRLTQIPNVFHQDTRQNDELKSLLSAVLLRKLRPSLYIGTRSILNTISAYTHTPRPYSNTRFREIIKVSYDGATIALDWEVPDESNDSDNDSDGEDYQKSILHGKIKTAVVLILHGVNTDTTSGYMRAIMQSCTRRGYIAAGMNSRGCGKGVDLSTPRLNNAAYTNDLRYEK